MMVKTAKKIWRGVVFSLCLVLMCSFGLALAAVWFVAEIHRPAAFSEARVLLVNRGDGRIVISSKLNHLGIQHHEWMYQLEEWRRGAKYLPKAGEYEVPAGASLARMMDIVNEGKSIQHSVTITEGLTVDEVMRLLENDERLVGEITFVPPEGSILPETYFFLRGVRRGDLITRMQQAREVAFAELWSEREESLPISSLDQAVVLASIVEKETGLVEERALVASVFLNRLTRGMRLQSDPTVIYGLVREGREVKRLTRDDLRHSSPWNTYQVAGLPPTPISNPGLASFQAVMDPAETDYLYFVADGKGGHRFAETYEQHKKNVRLWREISQETE